MHSHAVVQPCWAICTTAAADRKFCSAAIVRFERLHTNVLIGVRLSISILRKSHTSYFLWSIRRSLQHPFLFATKSSRPKIYCDFLVTRSDLGSTVPSTTCSSPYALQNFLDVSMQHDIALVSCACFGSKLSIDVWPRSSVSMPWI